MALPSSLRLTILRRIIFFFSSRRRHTRWTGDWSSDVCSSDLVGHAGAEARPAWGEAPGIPREHAIHGFHGVTIWAEHGDDTERVLVDTLGFRPLSEDGTTRRFAVGDGGPGAIVDVRSVGGFVLGAGGAGTVHHVAWRVPDDAAQLGMREQVTQAGLEPTPVIDRNYFHSVYFREPGGVLFELATDPPGFAI